MYNGTHNNVYRFGSGSLLVIERVQKERSFAVAVGNLGPQGFGHDDPIGERKSLHRFTIWTNKDVVNGDTSYFRHSGPSSSSLFGPPFLFTWVPRVPGGRHTRQTGPPKGSSSRSRTITIPERDTYGIPDPGRLVLCLVCLK